MNQKEALYILLQTVKGVNMAVCNFNKQGGVKIGSAIVTPYLIALCFYKLHPIVSVVHRDYIVCNLFSLYSLF